MIKYSLFLLLPLSLFASKILSYNVYDRTDRADIMITFDTPFTGKIKQSTIDSKIVVKLEGASIESPKIKKVNSPFLQSLSITPMLKETQVVASVSSSTELLASKTSDGYGLRLRFKKQSQTQQNTSTSEESSSLNPFAALPTKKDEGISQSYYIVVGFLLLATMTLFYFKRKIQTKSNMRVQDRWLFKSDETQAQTPSKTESSSNNESFSLNDAQVSIRFQKALNNENSVVMLDFGSQSYLVLMGKSNILLDKFTDDKPTTQEEFQTILQSRHEQLEDFLGVKSGGLSKKEPLQAYKERAASIAYGEDL